MSLFCGRRWRKKLFFSCTVLIGFMSLWMFMTLLLLSAQEQYFKNESHGTPADDYMGRGVQVVVGHYNGNLPSEENKKKNLSKETINANNFEPHHGVGDNGRAVRLNGDDELKAKDLFQINQFNIVASDRIALNRTLPDVRKKSCREKIYPDNLPDTSVIIVFHNEAYSTLLRTVVSVINRSPRKLLKEIILVDDNSSRDFLNEPLESFVAQTEVPVHIVRAPKRVGLIRARLLGAEKAKGQVLTFLDSHCECTQGWLEPLLARIAEDRTVAVCPIIDVLNDQTFAYNKGIELFRGGFNWNLQFRWYAVPPSELNRRAKDVTAPILSPTMAGGLFSIDKVYFDHVGSYDNQMDIWGGENLEMSFRIWQCGGKVEILPCSHVGHVFRKASPHDFPDKGSSKILNSNLVRVAEVWMDEWKYIFYNTASQAKELAKTIDVSERLELRKKLNCKSFKWYLDNVWPENFMPREGHFFGRIKNLATDQCLQLTYVMAAAGSGTEKRISVEPCTENFNRLQIENMGTKACIVSTPGSPVKRKHSLSMQRCTLGFDMWQLWVYFENKIKGDEHQCLTAAEISSSWLVQLKECTETERDLWDYSEYKKTFVHRHSQLCLDKPDKVGAKDEVQLPTLTKCARDSSGQRWNMISADWKPKSSA